MATTRTTRKPAARKTAVKPVDDDREVVGPASDDDFEYETEYGTITVPSLARLPKPKGLEMLRLQAERDQVVREANMMLVMLQNAAGGPNSPALRIIGQLDYDEFGEFVAAWGEHSGVSAGE